nr:MAG TPA: hypothetical protein [Caudoviricetes sp.]
MGDFALNLERNLSYYGEGNSQVIILMIVTLLHLVKLIYLTYREVLI